MNAFEKRLSRYKIAPLTHRALGADIPQVMRVVDLRVPQVLQMAGPGGEAFAVGLTNVLTATQIAGAIESQRLLCALAEALNVLAKATEPAQLEEILRELMADALPHLTQILASQVQRVEVAMATYVAAAPPEIRHLSGKPPPAN